MGQEDKPKGAQETAISILTQIQDQLKFVHYFHNKQECDVDWLGS